MLRFGSSIAAIVSSQRCGPVDDRQDRPRIVVREQGPVDDLDVDRRGMGGHAGREGRVDLVAR